MQELTEPQFLATMSSNMKGFKLSNPKDIDTILELAKDLLKARGISTSSLSLQYCYENEPGTFSHYLVNWGMENQFIAIIANDSEETWHGFRIMDMKKEYSIEE